MARDMVGANLEQLQALEQRFQSDGQVVNELHQRLTAMLHDTAWTGPAADRFRELWNQEFSRALVRLQEALRENADVVRSRRQAIHTATS